MKPLVHKKAKRVRQQPPVRLQLHVTKGDTVQVISGDDKGKRGQDLQVYPKTGRVVVQGVNMSSGTSARRRPPRAGSSSREAPIHHSKVMLIDPKTRRADAGPPAAGRRRHGRADRA